MDKNLTTTVSIITHGERKGIRPTKEVNGEEVRETKGTGRERKIQYTEKRGKKKTLLDQYENRNRTQKTQGSESYAFKPYKTNSKKL